MPSKFIIYIFFFFFLFKMSIAYAVNEDHQTILYDNGTKNSFQLTLHKNGDGHIPGDTHPVFNIPFPPSYIFNAGDISISNKQGKALSIHPEITSYWNFIDNEEQASIRSLKIHLNNDDNHSFPLILNVNKQTTKKHLLTKKPVVAQRWISKVVKMQTKNSNYSIIINEPFFYATFSPKWLSACLFRTKTLPAKNKSSLGWFDEASINFANNFDHAFRDTKLVNNEINLTNHRTWQYDLAATLFNSYIKTGELKWLKQAHIATQIYSHFINDDGIWTLKEKPDMKFSYNLSMFIDYLLVGDEKLLPKIEAVAKYVSSWRPNYERSYSFWTERHQTYSLLGATVAWEATANPKYAKRAKSVAKASINEAKYPESPWKPIGCLQHEFTDHDRGEGGESKIPVCSPWMSALLADAMLRYYIQSGDEQVLEFLYGLSAFVINHGIYIGENKKNRFHTIPRYLASAEKDPGLGGGVFNDKQHSCDVAGLLGKSLWAGKLIDKDTLKIKSTIDALLIPCQDDLQRNHRQSKKSGEEYWRYTHFDRI